MDDNYVETDGLTYKKDKSPMYDEDILMNNLFNGLSYKELLELWIALKDFYKRGYVLDDSPLEPWRKKFCTERYNGIIDMEKELLTILSVKFIELSLTEPKTRFIIDFSEHDKPVW